MIKVLYILGIGRSGSTLLDILLGEFDGFFSAGELQSLWEGAILEGRLCGCGAPVSECPMWSCILDPERQLALNLDPAEIVQLQREKLKLHRWWHLPPEDPTTDEGAGRDYLAFLSKLYRRIADVTGAEVVVDSSKLPLVGALLESVPGIEPYFVHLVRDPRAVAYSWQRRKRALDRQGAPEMDRFGIGKSALMWATRHISADRLGPRSRPWMLVRYEDLVANPRKSLSRIVELVEQHPRKLDFLQGRTARVTCNHTVSGNPIRLGADVLELSEDAEWKTCLDPLAHTVATALTLPLLIRYGYGTLTGIVRNTSSDPGTDGC